MSSDNNLGILKEFKKLDKELNNSDAFFGKTMLTKFNKINSSRGLMFSSHLDQFEDLDTPEIATSTTGYEDLVGEYSTGYYKTDRKLKIVDRIIKFDFDDAPEELRKMSYILIVYDEENDMYDIIEKHNFEKLTETYGYVYNTKILDDYMENGGDIPKGEILYRSSSYDDNMNYRMGVNAKCIYLIDTDTTEDAIKISKSFAKKLTSTKIDIVRIPMNDNDVFINYYGKGDEYKTFPDVGEKIKRKTIAIQRRLSYSQLLFDMKSENLSKPNYMTDTAFYSKGTIVDINIYCNKELDEIDDAMYNGQILKYYKNQIRYHKEIVKKLSKYKEECDGRAGDELNFLLKKAREALDPDTKWRDSNNSVFSNMNIEFSVMKKNKVKRGQKLTGRAGNKGVVSKIVPDEEMPIIAETGEPVDIILNGLGDFNRINPAQKDEVEISFITNRVLELYIKPEKSFKKKKEYLYDIISDFNPNQGNLTREYIESMSKSDQETIMEEIINTGIRIEDPPFWNNVTFDHFKKIYKKWDKIEKYHLYTYRYGRKVKMLNTHVVGNIYILKLKHTAENKFSVRSTAHVNVMDLPEKSSATKNNKSLYAKTPVMKIAA